MKQMARWGALPLLAVPVGTWALGLGDIQLQSALDQPLRAQIRLSATKEELQGLDISMADPATFQRYGLDRPGFLSSLNFTIGKDSAGHDVIRVTSSRPINEPFVTMLIQATWPKGRSLREYTVLLDPPVFRKQESAPVREAQSAPAATTAPQAAASSASGAIARPQSAPAVRTTPLPAAAPAVRTTPLPAAASAPRSAPARAAPAPAPARAATNVRLGGTYGPVHRAETLWSIASQVRPAGATMNQTLVALYRANQQAFEGNMNLLRAGATLKVPTRADIGDVVASNATAEVRRQTEQWRAGRGAGQAGAQAAGQQQARLRLEPAGTGSANAGAAAAPAAASATGGESANANATAGVGSAAAAGTAALRGQVDTLQSQLKESRRLLQVRDQQLRNLQDQLSAAKATAGSAAKSTQAPGESSAGAQLEPDQVFAEGQQNKSAKGGQKSAASTGNEAASATQPGEAPAQAATQPATKAPATERAAKASTAAAAGPPAAKKKVMTTTSAPPSLLSRLISTLATPIVLIGLGAGALLLTALWYLRRRREEVEDVTGRWEALEAEAEADDIDHATTARLRGQVPEKDFIVEESTVAPEKPPQPPPVERPVASVADSSATGTFEAPIGESTDSDETLSSQTVINLDQADPVAEADFHMAYGLYDQAAELVSQAIQKDPGNRGLKLKLLEVFFVWGNKEAFLDAAKAFRAEVGDAADPDWDKVIIMGKQICPDEALFADATAGAAQVDVDLDAGEGDSQALDFAFDESADEDAGAATDTHSNVDLDLSGGADDSLDLQLEATGNREPRTGIGESAQSKSDESAFAASNDALDIGAETSAGLEEALFGLDDDDDTGRRTSPDVDVDSLAVTQESPTVETPHGGFGSEHSGITMESPTVEMDQASDYASDADAPTVETPTVEAAYGGAIDATVESSAMGEDKSPTELTAEIDLDDLGLDVKDLEDLPQDIGELPSADDGESDTREQPSIDADADDLLSATGVTQVLGEADMDLEHVDTSVLGGNDATMKAPSLDENTLTGTEVLEQPPTEGLEDAGKQTGSGLDLDLDDVNAALQGGDTVEQPTMRSFGNDVFKGNGQQTPVDLDVGSDMSGNDDPTGTEDMGALDPQTMTEVGTKLDLARAYIDMGDPEGARSILEEVLDEGDAGQKREAQSLMEALTA